eukprot:2691711-Rhodomonas_salina.1
MSKRTVDVRACRLPVPPLPPCICCRWWYRSAISPGNNHTLAIRTAHLGQRKCDNGPVGVKATWSRSGCKCSASM